MDCYFTDKYLWVKWNFLENRIGWLFISRNIQNTGKQIKIRALAKTIVSELMYSSELFDITALN